jgi:hypothetical protein
MLSARLRLALLLPALLLLAAPVRAGDKVETKFTRFVEAEDEGQASTLQVAYATYRSKDTDVELVLYGAVHIADKAYYKAVQKDLDACDVVLYEGVSASPDMKPDETMKSIGEMQTTMGQMLGLTFQKDGINYKAKNLVHADMTAEELLKATDGDISKALPGMDMFKNPETMKMLKPMLKMMKGMKLPPMMRDPLKLQMAKQLANADMASLPGGDDAMKILVGERNKVALKVLDSELAKRKTGRIAIFYGAAHMKDFHARLGDKGWTQKSVSWNNAWTIGGDKPKDDDEPKQPKKHPRTTDEDESRTPAPSDERDGVKRRWF